MKIPFDIKFRPQIESGEYKVVTSFGEPAEIVKWDCKGQYPLLACIFDGDTDDAAFYTEGGKGVCNSKENYLSIVTPEPELSEFENKLRVICEDAVRESQLFPERTSEDFAKKHSAELLDLARKELEPEVLERLEVAYKNQDEVVYENGKRDGKAEALKDLPRWKPAARAYDGDRLPRIDWLLNRFVARFEEGIFYLDMNDLYKLPGFKED